MSLHSFYQEKVNDCDLRLQDIRGRMTGVAILRGLLFIGLVAGIYFLTQGFSVAVLVLCIVLFGGFVAAIGYYFRLRDKRDLWEKVRFVYANELAMLGDGIAGPGGAAKNGFPDGRAFLDSDNYLDDLDIFGSASLFHMLNRTTTSHGTDTLASWLRQDAPVASTIEARQDAIRVLSEQTDLRVQLTAQGLLNNEKAGNLHTLGTWLSSPSLLYGKKGILIGIWVLTIYNLGAVLWYLDSNNYLPLSAGIIISWIFTGRYISYIGKQHILISHKQSILDQYASILKVFNTATAGSSLLLQELQDRTGKAAVAIRQLSRLAAFFDQRLNMLVNIFLNSLLLYDLRVMIALEKWKETNKSAFPGWIEAVGSVECLVSFSTFAYNNPGYAWPVVAAHKQSFIEAQQLAHPLIPANLRVANDLTIGNSEKLILVTGSNMSGKTTFLRTLGVNLLLAQCGAPVCATAFTFTPMQLLTSLRISDSLQEQTSYFMAELKKLQKIIHRLRTGAPALVLIDEILRGTNSEDKTYGSEQFIRKLVGYPCLALFATHDLTLGQLETELPGVVSNYCFESVIEGNDLHFNYMLQRGVARNRNASFLMKKMDII